MSRQQKVIILLGTTASGKTKLGVKLANFFNGEIISADSRQIYKGMDIGTGKDLEEYQIKGKRQKAKGKSINKKFKIIKIPYYLIDVINPKTQFTLARWLKLTHKAINDIFKKGKTPIIVGGTGLYFNALINNYQLPPAKLDKKLRTKLDKLTLDKLLIKLKKLDFKTYQRIDKKNRRRVQRALEIILQIKKPLTSPPARGGDQEGVGAARGGVGVVGAIPPCPRGGEGLPAGRQGGWENYDFLILGITYPRRILNQRINERLEKRLKQGMVREVKKLHQQGVSWKRLEDFGLEYRFIARYLQGKLTYKEMREKLKIAIHQFAKKQMTWFKRTSNTYWIKNYSQAKKLTEKYLLA